MHHIAVFLPLAIATLIALAGCSSNAVSSDDQASAPAFTLPAVDGTSVSLSDLLDNRAAAVLRYCCSTEDSSEVPARAN